MIRNINYVAICNFMDYAKQVDKSQGEKAKRIIEPKPGNTRKKGTVQEIRRICERKEKNDDEIPLKLARHFPSAHALRARARVILV